MDFKQLRQIANYYIHSEEWIQKQETGIRWDDPILDIKWPMNPTFISEKDLLLPFLRDF